ncbi:MAG TPA: hypothetical protein VJB66_00775 [Candidatus Nanoarchaeia archaeon]|nr:hypothetical protein [Candidatus Nanoarchaeia archaeon]
MANDLDYTLIIHEDRESDDNPLLRTVIEFSHSYIADGRPRGKRFTVLTSYGSQSRMETVVLANHQQYGVVESLRAAGPLRNRTPAQAHQEVLNELRDSYQRQQLERELRS